MYHTGPKSPGKGELVRAPFLSRLAESVITRITVIGGRVQRSGTSVTIEVDEQRRGRVALYEATADAADGEVTLEGVLLDGTLDGHEITMPIVTGIDVREGDSCILVVTADGKRAAYPRGSGAGFRTVKVTGWSSGSGYTGTFDDDQGTTGNITFTWEDGIKGTARAIENDKHVAVYQRSGSWYIMGSPYTLNKG
jgi:hypothetical protein